MSNDFEDTDDDDYFSETIDDADLTGLEPKFVKIKSMQLTPPEMVGMKVDQLIETYIDARNQLATDRKGYNQREAKVKEHLQVISMILRDRGDAAGVDSFATEKGTAFRHLKEKFRVPGWDECVAYVKQTGNFQIFQKRVAANAIREIREQDGAIPPGVECIPEIEFAVRSPTVRRSKK